MGIAVLHDVIAARKDLALYDILRIGDRILLDGDARRELNGLAAQGAGNGQLIEAQRRRRRREAACHRDRRIHAYGDRDRKRLPQLGRALGHSADVAGAGQKENGELVLGQNTHAVDRHIREPCVRVCRIAHAECDIGTCIVRRISRCRDQLEQVKIRIRRKVYHLLCGGRFIGYDRHDGIGSTLLY